MNAGLRLFLMGGDELMKAISLWQPWASAIARGAKYIETRRWATNYRGPLAIHAAKHENHSELIAIASDWSWCAALGWKKSDPTHPWERIPFGAIVATCTLAACLCVEDIPIKELDALRFRGGHGFDSWTERMMGDFSPGRFGWVLTNVKPLENPIPYRGAQGLFNVEISL